VHEGQPRELSLSQHLNGGCVCRGLCFVPLQLAEFEKVAEAQSAGVQCEGLVPGLLSHSDRLLGHAEAVMRIVRGQSPHCLVTFVQDGGHGCRVAEASGEGLCLGRQRLTALGRRREQQSTGQSSE
jgi:hypothetical protein